MVDSRRQDSEFVQYNLGHYEVLEELGEGGIGEVYVARPTRGEHAGSLVCLKIMRRTLQAAKDSRRQAAIDSLRREARVVSQLRHPNIAMLLDSGAFNDVWFLAFELIAGANLGEILELQPAGVGLAPQHVRRIGIEVAAALQCAHEHDVLHRDIKPHNILISTSGQVKVVDFGVAKMNAREAAEFTVGVGTPRYWAPEQVREGVVTPQTDIFALGLVLYELLTTSHPFHHDDPGEHRKNVLRGTLPPRLAEAGIPADLVAIVECCLASDPAKRFRSAQALQAALRTGAKASGFEYEMGEIATAARDAVVVERLLLKDGVVADPGNQDETAIPDAYLRETRHASPEVLAETVKDSIPGALTQHVRDQVIQDLSLLAQHAYEQRQTHVGRRRQATATEGWQHPGISGVRSSDPSRAPDIHPPGARPTAATQDAGAPNPELLDKPRQDPEPRTQPDRAPKAGHDFAQLGGDAAPLLEAHAHSDARPLAHDANATEVVPRKHVPRWPLAIAAVVIAAISAVLATSSGTREHEDQERQAREATTQQQAQAPAPQPAVAVEAKRGATAGPLGGAPPEQSAADPLPLTRADSKPAAQTAAPTADGSSITAQWTKPARTEPRNLVQVTIGIIPFGNVLVDGKPLGPAPVAVKLAPGPHRIVGRSLELRRTQTVVVTAETSNIVLDLRNDNASQ